MCQVYIANNSYSDGVQKAYLTMRINIMNKSYEDAILSWITLAKEGDVDTQYHLGLMYAYGNPSFKDIVVAYAWWNVSAAQGNDKAAKNRDALEKEMTPSQLLKARGLSKVYYPKYEK
jgi:TPR repeat protein